MNSVSRINRRKEERVPMEDSVYVVIDTQPQMMGQVVEISSTGMAFNFVDLDSVSQRLIGRNDLTIDIFGAGIGFTLKNLPARLVSTVDTLSTNTLSSLIIKRIGVEFISPSISQQVQINTLIKRQITDAGLEMAAVL